MLMPVSVLAVAYNMSRSIDVCFARTRGQDQVWRLRDDGTVVGMWPRCGLYEALGHTLAAEVERLCRLKNNAPDIVYTSEFSSVLRPFFQCKFGSTNPDSPDIFGPVQCVGFDSALKQRFTNVLTWPDDCDCKFLVAEDTRVWLKLDTQTGLEAAGVYIALPLNGRQNVCARSFWKHTA
jgi:hypothetical protein